MSDVPETVGTDSSAAQRADHLVDLIDGNMPLSDHERSVIREYAVEAFSIEPEPPPPGLTVDQLDTVAKSLVDALDRQRIVNLKRGLREHARESHDMKKGVLSLSEALRSALTSQS